MRNKFKKFGGERIPDIIEYLECYIKKNPQVTISVGCDSVQKRHKTMFGCTIMMYNSDIRNGAHIVFFRDNVEKIKTNYDRLYRECELAYNLSEFLCSELSSIYKREDLTDFQRKMYKFHLMKCSGEYKNLNPNDIKSFVESLPLSDFERKIDWKLVDIHLDFNPNEWTINSGGKTNNKSNTAYKNYVPWLRGMNYRTWAKPQSYAASCAADLILED